VVKRKRRNVDVLASEIETLPVDEAVALIERFSGKIMNEPVGRTVCALASSLVTTQLMMKIMAPEDVRAAIELAELIMAD
jgi:hypothetical protein